MSTDDEELRMILDCENRESKLTDWERGFLDSLRRKLENGYLLTGNQPHKLEEIWERVTAE